MYDDSICNPDAYDAGLATIVCEVSDIVGDGSISDDVIRQIVEIISDLGFFDYDFIKEVGQEDQEEDD